MGTTVPDPGSAGTAATTPDAETSARFRFFHRWLLGASLLFLAQSLSWVVFGRFDPFGLWDRLLADALFEGALDEDVIRLRRFLLGPLGATAAGYFLMVTMLVHRPMRRLEAWAYRTVVAAVLLWFTVDSSASILHGAWFNVWLVDVPCLVVIGVPLAGLFPWFRSRDALRL